MLASLLPPGVNEEEKNHFLDRWNSSRTIRERLVNIFLGKLEGLVKDDEDVTKMADANWQLRQAYNLGRRKAYRDMINHLRQEEE